MQAVELREGPITNGCRVNFGIVFAEQGTSA